MVKSPQSKAIVVSCVNKSFRNGHSCAEYLFHKIGHFGKMYLVDFDECGQFVSDIVPFLVHGPEVILMEASDVDQVVHAFVVVDDLHL